MNNKPPRPITAVVFEQEAREKIKNGIDVLEKAVGASLGARGLMTGIDRGYEKVILRDGVSIAKSIFLKDPTENFALEVAKEAAQKSVEDVGDGTTATIILAHAIYTEAEKIVATGVHPRALIDEIEKDIKTATKLLKEQAKPITTLKEKIEVATISSEEESLGKLIGETLNEIGDQGVVTVEHSKSGETFVDMQEGMQWDRGYASPYFMTNPESQSANLEDSYILVTDHAINNFLELRPFLEKFLQQSRFLTVIAPEFGGDALTSFVANKMENKFIGLCLKAPGAGGHQIKMLQDIALLTGATFISNEAGHKLSDVSVEHLGKAKRVSANDKTSLISGGEGDKEAIRARVEELKKQIAEETNDFELERLRERMAKLSKGVAVIKVGGATDIEIKERYERALDACLATRKAVESGIVAGGEIVYLGLIDKVKSTIVKKALEAPFKRLVANAGMDDGQMLERIKTSTKNGYGIDVTTGTITNMIEKGIIDPVAVSIAALTNASSVALQLLNTTLIVTPEENEK